jgi:hypothetical protein
MNPAASAPLLALCIERGLDPARQVVGPADPPEVQEHDARDAIRAHVAAMLEQMLAQVKS